MNAVDNINHLLSIDGVVTTNGDELKCWTYSEEDGNRYKTYLDANNCDLLAASFAELAIELRRATPSEGDPHG